jgi:hypothetical protein
MIASRLAGSISTRRCAGGANSFCTRPAASSISSPTWGVTILPPLPSAA